LSPVSRGTSAGDAYLDLKNQAQRTGRATQELLQLYVLEGFLARLAASRASDNLVLKCGVLLAALNARRATKDVDLAGRDLDNFTDAVLELIQSVLGDNHLDDGIQFVPETATADVIRDDDQYYGVRVHIDARLASARLPFHVDVNVGDPIWPEPTLVDIPRLRGGDPIRIAGYPLHMVHAEKIVTAVQRGIANPRWRLRRHLNPGRTTPDQRQRFATSNPGSRPRPRRDPRPLVRRPGGICGVRSDQVGGVAPTQHLTTPARAVRRGPRRCAPFRRAATRFRCRRSRVGSAARHLAVGQGEMRLVAVAAFRHARGAERLESRNR
jgi:hypothetical protein